MFLRNKIGAKCELVEAYYQLGMTYQILGDREKSIANLQRALRLFKEIQVPN